MSFKATRYEGMLLMASIIWGTSFAAIKVGVSQVDVYAFTFLRYGVAAVSIVIILLLMRSGWGIFRWKELWYLAIINAAAALLQNLGMMMTTATDALLLIDINVVYIALIAALVLKEKLTKQIALGLTLGLAGVLFIATEGDPTNVFNGSATGNIIVFLASVIWAVYVVYLTKILRVKGRIIEATGVIMVETTLVLAPICLVLATSWSSSLVGWSSIIYLGLASTTFASFLYSYGLERLGATLSSIIMMAEIVFGLLFSYLLLGEQWDGATVIGGAFIMLAIAVISIRLDSVRGDGSVQE
ncbi:MAG: DMT family transporter [Methanomassiliicoccales archaeon]